MAERSSGPPAPQEARRHKPGGAAVERARRADGAQGARGGLARRRPPARPERPPALHVAAINENEDVALPRAARRRPARRRRARPHAARRRAAQRHGGVAVILLAARRPRRAVSWALRLGDLVAPRPPPCCSRDASSPLPRRVPRCRTTPSRCGPRRGRRSRSPPLRCRQPTPRHQRQRLSAGGRRLRSSQPGRVAAGPYSLGSTRYK